MADSLVSFNLMKWVDEHRELLKPPVGNQLIWQDSEFIIMIIGGPNSRRDFHIDPGDEFFYQLEGDMVLEHIDSQGKRQRTPIRQGEVLLCPANTPHSPQRPANSIGLVVERVRGTDEPEGFAWYCEGCDAKIHDIAQCVGDIVTDLRQVLSDFNADESLRTCKNCGYVQPVPTGPRI